jgi:hypothetical protein
MYFSVHQIASEPNSRELHWLIRLLVDIRIAQPHRATKT